MAVCSCVLQNMMENICNVHQIAAPSGAQPGTPALWTRPASAQRVRQLQARKVQNMYNAMLHILNRKKGQPRPRFRKGDENSSACGSDRPSFGQWACHTHHNAPPPPPPTTTMYHCPISHMGELRLWQAYMAMAQSTKAQPQPPVSALSTGPGRLNEACRPLG